MRPDVIPLPGARAQDADGRFAFLCEVGGAAVAMIDVKRRRVVGANDQFAALLGYGRDTLDELPVEAFADAFARVLDAPLTVTTPDDGHLRWEARWRRRDGRVVDVQVDALELEGEPRRMMIVAHDRRGTRYTEKSLELARRIDAPPGTAVVWVDEPGRVIWANDAASLLLGHLAFDLVGQDVGTTLLDLPRDSWKAHLTAALARGRATFDATCRRKNGFLFPVTVDVHATDLDGERVACCFLADVTARENAKRDLAQAEERYALAALGANDGLWDWNIAASRVHYSPRWASLLGFLEHELPPLPSTWLDRVHPEDRARVEAELHQHLENMSPHFESEHRIMHRDGAYRWVLFRGIAVRDEQGVAVRMAGSTSDITHRKNAEARLRFEAFHDSLTGLANRALLIRRLHQSLESTRATVSEGSLAMVFVDIDDFKLVNDSLGHTMGDMLLRAIASRLKRCVRAVDTVARLGGDEFCLLLEHVNDIADVLRVADRVQEELGIPFNLRGYEVFTSASVGVAVSRPDYHEAEDMLRDANIAMYRAKAAGRGKRAIFDASMRRAAVNRLTLETDLRRALERDEFEVFYQPIVSLETGAVTGFEALLRWPHPKRGLVMPADFIPLAEETGLIVPIGRWALQAACEHAMKWSQMGLGPLIISVNVSGRQLSLPYFVDQVAEVIETTGIEPGRLNLEITESVLMENAESIVTKLKELRALGVRLSIDDFGTGYSSLAYLHRFPIDTLKIDRSFITNPTIDDDPWAIVATIRHLATVLGMEVTAEGIEQEDHVGRLRALKVDHVQGYFISRPIRFEEVPALVASGERW
ncbi:MAG: EAL domain-containing protein [Myxococcales bacterium]|nr:EAL domain-containing protein [Myxococcales bacterium]MCB9732911.1 EAL domain-containing protein [Deltaproteobacteria bacterium]